MNIRYDGYEYIIMDATALLYPLDNALWSSLPDLATKGKLCAASTLKSDIREFRAAFEDLKACYPKEFKPDHLEQMDKNITRLNQLDISFTIFNYTDYGNTGLGSTRHDVWSLVKKLKDRKTLLITGSETLFQRVVLDDTIQIDLLSTDPNYKQQFFTPAEQRRCKAPFELERNREPLDTPVDTNCDNLTLYDEDGNSVQLTKKWFYGNKIEGSESYIYKGNQTAAKVYLQKPLFIRGLQGNIRKMAEFSKDMYFPWVLFPGKLLYHTPPVDKDSLIVGYTMLQVSPNQTFQYFFDGVHKDKLYTSILKILQTTLRRIMLLSCHGILVLDYNTNNFWYDDNTQDVRFLDACSYSYGTYTTSCRSGELKPLVDYFENDKYLYDKSLLIQEHLDLTHLFLISMMMGSESIEQVHHEQPIIFLISTENEGLSKHFAKLVPPRLKELFKFLYQDGPDLDSRPFSLEILLEELSIAIEGLCDETVTFQELFDSSPGLEQPEIFKNFTYDCVDDVFTVQCNQKDLPNWSGQEQNNDTNSTEEASADKSSKVGRSRAYIPARVHPPVRTIPVSYDPSNHLSRKVRSLPDPLPLVYQGKNRYKPVLYTVLSILLILLGLIAVDILFFSGTDIGFSFPLYLENKFGPLMQQLHHLLHSLADLLTLTQK